MRFQEIYPANSKLRDRPFRIFAKLWKGLQDASCIDVPGVSRNLLYLSLGKTSTLLLERTDYLSYGVTQIVIDASYLETAICS